MSSKFFRQLTMLRHIPRYPSKTTTRSLVEVLEDEGFDVTQRTIQRNLKVLSGILLDLQVDDEKDFPGWSWAKDTQIQDIPTMNGNMALTFLLADHFLKQMFPPSILNHLKPYFDNASNVIKAIDNSDYSQWEQKVRIFPRTQKLLPASIVGDVVTVVYDALFQNKQFRGRYITRAGDEVEYDVHPLGLIFRDSVVYLVCTIWDYDDPRHLALHRFKFCELLDRDAVSPEGFDLDDYLTAGSFEYGEIDGEKIPLKVMFFNGAGHHLLETPLGEDQVVTEVDQGQLQIEATVNNSAQLRWWLLGFGDNAEVLGPEEMREEFRNVAHTMFYLYQK